MKTLTISQLRPKVGAWLDRVLAGEDVGITWRGKIVALRPVEVHSDDYVLREYGVDAVAAEKALRRAEREIARERRAGRIKEYKPRRRED